jgi:hypothetical protein
LKHPVPDQMMLEMTFLKTNSPNARHQSLLRRTRRNRCLPLPLFRLLLQHRHLPKPQSPWKLGKR